MEEFSYEHGSHFLRSGVDPHTREKRYACPSWSQTMLDSGVNPLMLSFRSSSPLSPTRHDHPVTLTLWKRRLRVDLHSEVAHDVQSQGAMQGPASCDLLRCNNCSVSGDDKRQILGTRGLDDDPPPGVVVNVQ